MTAGRPLLKTLRMTDPSAHAAHHGAVSAVVLAAVLLGTAGTISWLGPDTVRPVDAAAWRTLVGGLGLIAVAGVRRYRYPTSGRPAPPRPFVLGSGAVALVVNQLAFFDAIDRIGVAGGTLLTIVTVPIVAGLIDVASRRPPTRTWSAGVMIGVAGVALLVVPGAAPGAPTDPIGVVAALCAGGAAAWWGRSAQVLMEDRSPIDAMAALCGLAAVMFAPLAVAGASEAITSVPAAITVSALGLATMTAAFSLWGIGLAALPLGVVASATLLEPLVAGTLAIAVVGEPATPALMGGGALVVAGVALATRPAPRGHRPSRNNGPRGELR